MIIGYKEMGLISKDQGWECLKAILEIKLDKGLEKEDIDSIKIYLFRKVF